MSEELWQLETDCVILRVEHFGKGVVGISMKVKKGKIDELRDSDKEPELIVDWAWGLVDELHALAPETPKALVRDKLFKGISSAMMCAEPL